MRISKCLFYVIWLAKRGANECLTADGTSTNEGLMCERDIKNMCVLVCSNMQFLFSLFVTHLDQTPINQLWPRPILIKSSKVNILLVQYCNTTVYCTPFSLFLFTVHWHIYTKQLLHSLCSWMYQTFVCTGDAPKLTCTHIHLSETHNHDKYCDRVISKLLEIQPVLIERKYSSVHMDIRLIVLCLNSLPTMTETLG